MNNSREMLYFLNGKVLEDEANAQLPQMPKFYGTSCDCCILAAEMTWLQYLSPAFNRQSYGYCAFI